MANVTYLIGAGASAGKRGKDLPGGDPKDNSIHEGLPCVNEIPNRLLYYVNLLRNTPIPNDIWNNPIVGLNSKLDWEYARKALLNNFQQLYTQCLRHATIDTYAKKLKLRQEEHDFQFLEQILTLFFIYEQILLNPDSRYDTFFANVLENDLQIPSHIQVLSWNYDSMFELAYSEYNNNGQLKIGSKRDTQKQDYNIIKINGTATFQKQMQDLQTMRTAIQTKFHLIDQDRSISDVVQAKQKVLLVDMVYNYQLYIAGKQNNTNLSFAFDDTRPSDAIYNCIDAIMEKTDVFVIIGYSFPFFNREIDRKILSRLRPQAAVYIQDKYPNRIKQNFRAVKNTIPEGHIELKEETDQFFLPPEL